MDSLLLGKLNDAVSWPTFDKLNIRALFGFLTEITSRTAAGHLPAEEASSGPGNVGSPYPKLVDGNHTAQIPPSREDTQMTSQEILKQRVGALEVAVSNISSQIATWTHFLESRASKESSPVGGCAVENEIGGSAIAFTWHISRLLARLNVVEDTISKLVTETGAFPSIMAEISSMRQDISDMKHCFSTQEDLEQKIRRLDDQLETLRGETAVRQEVDNKFRKMEHQLETERLDDKTALSLTLSKSSDEMTELRRQLSTLKASFDNWMDNYRQNSAESSTQPLLDLVHSHHHIMQEELKRFVPWSVLEHTMLELPSDVSPVTHVNGNPTSEAPSSHPAEQHASTDLVVHVASPIIDRQRSAAAASSSARLERRETKLSSDLEATTQTDEGHPSQHMISCLHKLGRLAETHGISDLLADLSTLQKTVKHNQEHINNVDTRCERVGSRADDLAKQLSAQDLQYVNIMDSLERLNQDFSDMDGRIRLLPRTIPPEHHQGGQTQTSSSGQADLDGLLAELKAQKESVHQLASTLHTLQMTKADKETVSIEMNEKASKTDLGDKVNQETFSHTLKDLGRDLQSAIHQIESYRFEEQDLKQALSKIDLDLKNKMDTDEAIQMKNSLEQRLQELQQSRHCLEETTRDTLSYAAGMRRKLDFCLSCARPLINHSGIVAPYVMQSHAFPPSSTKLPHVASSYKMREPMDRISMTDVRLLKLRTARPRQCGGSHTVTLPGRAKTLGSSACGPGA